MAKETKKEVKKEVKEVNELHYEIIFPDGTKASGSTSLREFAPNVAKGFKNSGFQCKIASGQFSGSLMIIDYARQERI